MPPATLQIACVDGESHGYTVDEPTLGAHFSSRTFRTPCSKTGDNTSVPRGITTNVSSVGAYTNRYTRYDPIEVVWMTGSSMPN